MKFKIISDRSLYPLRNFRTVQEYGSTIKSANIPFDLVEHLQRYNNRNEPLEWLDAGCGLRVALHTGINLHRGYIRGTGIDCCDDYKYMSSDDADRIEQNIRNQPHVPLRYNHQLNIRACELDPDICFIQGDIGSMSLNKRFNLITSIFVLQYSQDPFSDWVNLFNHLAPNGLLLTNLIIPETNSDIVKMYSRFIAMIQTLGISADIYVSPSRKEDGTSRYRVYMLARLTNQINLKLSFTSKEVEAKEICTPLEEPFSIFSVSYKNVEVSLNNSDKLIKISI